MRKKQSKNSMYLMRNALSDSIKSIPKKNKQKFGEDLLTLIDKAHEDDYKDFSF